MEIRVPEKLTWPIDDAYAIAENESRWKNLALNCDEHRWKESGSTRMLCKLDSGVENEFYVALHMAFEL